jgi:hypothetical protein
MSTTIRRYLACSLGSIQGKITVVLGWDWRSARRSWSAMGVRLELDRYRVRSQPFWLPFQRDEERKGCFVDFLKHIKDDDYLKAIPVVFLSTSDSDMDAIDSYKRHANRYLEKTVDSSEPKEVIREIEEY